MSERERNHPIRACDGCRTRKRKCDGDRPYCSNCIKTSVRDEQGNPICTYSSVIKKRGPKKGYKETLLQRLESLEAILNPLSKAEALKEKLEVTSHWASKQPNRNQKIIMPEIIPPNINFASPYHIQHGASEEEFELHLLRVGMLFSNLSTNYRLSLIQGSDYQVHQRSVHSSLRMALCANGVFYSNHPYLMTMFDKSSNQPKLDFAKRFLNQAEKMLPVKYNNEMELTDAVRALHMIVDGYVALGELDEASRVSNRTRELIKQEHIFDPFIFNVEHHSLPNVDDLRVSFNRAEKPFKFPVLTDADIKERFHLWEECLAIDTFTSMSSGEDFGLDETLYPDEFKKPILQFMEHDSVFHVPVDYARLCAPQMARNTLWYETAMASTFDDVREMTCLAALHYSSGLLKFRLSLIRKVRRAIRYSRESSAGAVHRFPEDDILSLHTALLIQLESMPSLFLPFKSLSLFQPGSDTTSQVINNVWRSFVSFNHDLMFLLAGFAYIHLPMSTNPEKLYNLSTKIAKQYSSPDILMAVFKATVFITRALYTPIIGPEIHRQSPMVFENLSYSMATTLIPAPGLATIESAVSLYIISSSCLVMSKTNLRFASEVTGLVENAILPALKRIGFVKPMANNYYLKLQSMI